MKSVFFSVVMFPVLVLGQTQHPQLIDQIASLRLSIERIERAHKEIGLQRDRLAKQHERLAIQIQERKTKRTQPRLIPDFGLQQWLRKSQELSHTLTQLNRELLDLEKAKRDQMQRLFLVYDRLISQTSDAIRTDAGVGVEHSELLQVIAQVRVDRERLRLQLMPSPADRKLFQDERAWLASDDLDELSERLDALRDEQDRLNSALAYLDKQIDYIKANRLLEREMDDFMGDQELFDERSRLLASQNRVETGSPTDEFNDSDQVGQDPLPGGFESDDLREPSAPSSVPLGLVQQNDPARTWSLSLHDSNQRRQKILDELTHLEHIKAKLLTKIKSLGE